MEQADEWDSQEGSSKGQLETPAPPSTVFFNCTVSDPHKEQEGSQNAYISYLVTTESNSPSFSSQLVTVRRRFSDFVFLYDSLVHEFPASAVPPLPDRNRMEYLTGDRFGLEFTHKRASSLTRFLRRIALHVILRRARIFITFLDSNDWNNYKKNRIAKGGAGGMGGAGGTTEAVLDGISDTFLNAFAKVQSQNKELVESKESADKLESSLAHIEKAFTKVVRRQSDLVNDLEEFSMQTTKLADLVPNLKNDFVAFAKGISSMSESLRTLKDEVECGYVVSLRDMENYLQAVKQLVKQREQKQLDYEGLSDYLVSAQNSKRDLENGGGSNFLRSKMEDFRGVDHEASRQERMRKLDGRIDELNREVASAKITSDSYEQCVFQELDYFQRIKSQEMKSTLTDLASSNVKFYETMIKDWKATASELSVEI